MMNAKDTFILNSTCYSLKMLLIYRVPSQVDLTKRAFPDSTAYVPHKALAVGELLGAYSLKIGQSRTLCHRRPADEVYYRRLGDRQAFYIGFLLERFLSIDLQSVSKARRSAYAQAATSMT